MTTALFHATALLGALLLSSPLHAADAPPGDCIAKRAQLASQLEQAEVAGDRSRQASLKQALRQEENHCPDAARQPERKAQRQEAEAETTERRADLEQTRRSGDGEQTNTGQRQLEEAVTAPGQPQH